MGSNGQQCSKEETVDKYFIVKSMSRRKDCIYRNELKKKNTSHRSVLR